MTHQPLVDITTLSRSFGRTRAVHEISFQLQRGEVLGFLGPNGAGKTTTMQMLCGNLAPSAGQIRICGIDLLDQPKQAKAHLGYLPESPPLYPDASVAEYLEYCARLHRVTTKRIAPAIQQAMQRCGLAQMGDRLIGQLSKGYQQRVGIAQAIVHEPAVVVLDEPTVGLDPLQIREIRALIRTLGKDRGVILSTHILPEVLATCDRVQIIHDGRLVFADLVANLNRQLPPSRLMVRLEHTPDPDDLATILGIQAVASLPDGRLQIDMDPRHNPATAIAELAVTKGWGLQELVPEQHSLEQIFVELTSQENPPADIAS
jgi:ABC-2 type transport system ATP-binding protein